MNQMRPVAKCNNINLYTLSLTASKLWLFRLVHIKIKKTYLLKTSTNFSGVPPGLANARPPGRAKLGKAPAPGLTRRANAPQLPRWGGGGGGGTGRSWN